MTNKKEAAWSFTANEQRPPFCLAQGIPSTSSASSMSSHCEEGKRLKRKRNGSSDEAKRMKILSRGCNSQMTQESNQKSRSKSSRIDPCQLPPELFRRILSSLSFISLRHAMLVSWWLQTCFLVKLDSLLQFLHQVSRGWRNAAECPLLWRKLR